MPFIFGYKIVLFPLKNNLILLLSEWPNIFGVWAIVSAKGLKTVD